MIRSSPLQQVLFWSPLVFLRHLAKKCLEFCPVCGPGDKALNHKCPFCHVFYIHRHLGYKDGKHHHHWNIQRRITNDHHVYIISEYYSSILPCKASLIAQLVKNLPAVQETQVWSLGWEDPLEKEMVTHSSILAWKISWTEEPGGLQFMGLQRIRHNWETNTYLLTSPAKTWVLYIFQSSTLYHFSKGFLTQSGWIWSSSFDSFGISSCYYWHAYLMS